MPRKLSTPAKSKLEEICLSASQNKKQASHHDTFFKNVYSDPTFALELFELIFSKKERSAFDWKNLKTEKDTLKDKRADLVFSVPLKNHPKTNIKILILLEHKSYHDPMLFSQMLYYQTILHEGSLKSVASPIIPVVFYHGKTPWKWAKTFQEDIYKEFLPKIPVDLRKNMINYEIRLLDSNKLEGKIFKDKSIKSRGALYLMKQIWGLKLTYRQLKEVMAGFGEFSGDKDNRLIVSVLDYLNSFFKESEKFKSLWQKAEKELIEEGVFKRGGRMDVFKNIEERGVIKGLQKGLQKGLRKGRQEGREEGRQEGQQAGRQERDKEIILNMLKQNLDMKLVSKVTGLSAEEIKKLKNGS